MNIRNRLINFRVTDEEFDRLKTASALNHSRCLSDFARSAILETARAYEPAPNLTDSVASQLQAFDRRLAALESHMSRLFDAIADAKSAHDDPRSVCVKS
jgi:uncharacterized protein (DUF1778 family)